MTITTTSYMHVELNADNVPIISGTTMKVVELVTSHIVYGWSPEELHFQYPHVALSKIPGYQLKPGQADSARD